MLDILNLSPVLFSKKIKRKRGKGGREVILSYKKSSFFYDVLPIPIITILNKDDNIPK